MKKYTAFTIILLLFVAAMIFVVQKNKTTKNLERNILGYPEKYAKNGSKSNDVDRYYFEYDNSVYYHSGATIEWFGSTEAKDYKLENSNPKTFKIIDSNYAKDKNQVYYWARIVNKADPETFTPLDWPNAKDKNYYFSIDKITGAVQ